MTTRIALINEANVLLDKIEFLIKSIINGIKKSITVENVYGTGFNDTSVVNARILYKRVLCKVDVPSDITNSVYNGESIKIFLHVHNHDGNYSIPGEVESFDDSRIYVYGTIDERLKRINSCRNDFYVNNLHTDGNLLYGDVHVNNMGYFSDLILSMPSDQIRFHIVSFHETITVDGKKEKWIHKIPKVICYISHLEMGSRNYFD